MGLSPASAPGPRGPSERGDTSSAVTRLVGAGQRVLEAGCRGDEVTRALVDNGCAVVGLTAEGDETEATAKWCERVVVADLDSAELATAVGDDRFDVVVVNGALSRAQDPKRLLAQLRRVVDGGGYLVVSVPNGAPSVAELGTANGVPRQLFSRASLMHLLTAAELTPLHVTVAGADRTGDGAQPQLIAAASPTTPRGAMANLISTLGRQRDEFAARVEAKSHSEPVYSDAALLYLDLLKKALTRTGFGQPRLAAALPTDDMPPEQLTQLRQWLEAKGLAVVQRDPPIWPVEAETMVTLPRLDNLQYCIGEVVRDDIPGDFIETGVWRGGSSIFARAAFRALGDDTRTVWVCDSFEGLPKPDPERYPVDEGDMCWAADFLKVSLEEVQSNFVKYGMLDDQVKFLKGWFEDTMPTAPIDELSILRFDGDMYSSTMQVMDVMYPKLNVGGFCIIDDYGAVPSCAAAIEDFRAANNIVEPMIETDHISEVFWRKER